MPDLLSYSIADFILFSPEIYARMLQRYQQDIMPLPWVGFAAGLAMMWMVHRRRMHGTILILAACWAWVGWAFHIERYTQLNWAALYFGWAFMLQAVLMVITGVRGDLKRWMPGIVLIGLAVIAHPLIGFFTGHAWPSTGLFGTAPDPVAVATLGLSLTTRDWRRWALAIIPALWCVISVLTAFGLAQPALAITTGTGLVIWFVLVLLRPQGKS